MTETSLSVLVVVGSLNRKSSTRTVLQHVGRRLTDCGATVDFLDLLEEPLPVFNPDTSCQGDLFKRLKARVDRADAFVLGTPDYHGTMSSALKNFLDHFWHEFAGKLFASIVASHDKGLTVADHLRTVARQCYAWTLPYALAFADQVDIKDQNISEPFEQRLEMLARDVLVYGGLLARQRRSDLAGAEGCFMARWRR